MNRISTTTHRMARIQAVSAFALVAMTALTVAAWMSIATPAAGPAVVTLERVVIEGTRTAEVKQLPRVVIEGRRDAGADGVQLASR
ncbi:hypothetical protein ACG02S_00305 [Roseateles sp. DC23W]|uniref:Uncharacterized protein n=1 Tax=Pelomonas dachongensis TaxID=3299029 RepID=A0ABW7EHC6_9BURK